MTQHTPYKSNKEECQGQEDHDKLAQEQSLEDLVLWNVSKALEKAPTIPLKTTLRSMLDSLRNNERSNLSSVRSPEQHLTCAVLAWQQLGHLDADSLFSFIETRRNEINNQSRASTKVSEKLLSDVMFDVSVPPPAMPRSSIGEVVKLPISTKKFIMRIDQPQKISPKNSKATPMPKPYATDQEKMILEKLQCLCNKNCTACTERLTEMEEREKELRRRAEQLAQRETERAELLDKATAAWMDLEAKFHSRLIAAKEQAEIVLTKMEQELYYRKSLKEQCKSLSEELRDQSTAAEALRQALLPVEQQLAERARARTLAMEEVQVAEAACADQQCKDAILDGDFKFKEQQTRRKLFLAQSDLDTACALTMESERAMRAELMALRDQIRDVSEQLLIENDYNIAIMAELDDLRAQKNDHLEESEGCQSKCECKLKEVFDKWEAKKKELKVLEEKVVDCKCKHPVEKIIEVKRTPSLAETCTCLTDGPDPSCKCTSLSSSLLLNLLASLFRGLQLELGDAGCAMPCSLLKCLEDGHNWDKSTPVKAQLKKFFSELLVGELNIAIAVSIEKYHARWIGATCADMRKIPNMDDELAKEMQEKAIEKRAQKRVNELLEDLFKERAEELAKSAKEICEANPTFCECDKGKDAAVLCMLPQYENPFNKDLKYSCKPQNSTWKQTQLAVIEMQAEIENLKKASLKKQDLQEMEDKLKKSIKSTATSPFDESKKIRNNKTENQLNPKQRYKIRKDYKPILEKQKHDRSSGPNNKQLGQAYAVNVCFCDQPNKKIILQKERHTKVVTKRHLKRCPSNCVCFHCEPNNESLDRFIENWNKGVNEAPLNIRGCRLLPRINKKDIHKIIADEFDDIKPDHFTKPKTKESSSKTHKIIFQKTYSNIDVIVPKSQQKQVDDQQSNAKNITPKYQQNTIPTQNQKTENQWHDQVYKSEKPQKDYQSKKSKTNDKEFYGNKSKDRVKIQEVKPITVEDQLFDSIGESERQHKFSKNLTDNFYDPQLIDDNKTHESQQKPYIQRPHSEFDGKFNEDISEPEGQQTMSKNKPRKTTDQHFYQNMSKPKPTEVNETYSDFKSQKIKVFPQKFNDDDESSSGSQQNTDDNISLNNPFENSQNKITDLQAGNIIRGSDNQQKSYTMKPKQYIDHKLNDTTKIKKITGIDKPNEISQQQFNDNLIESEIQPKKNKEPHKNIDQQAYVIDTASEKQHDPTYAMMPNKVFDKQRHDKNIIESDSQQIPLNYKVNKLLDQRLSDNISTSKRQQKTDYNIKQKIPFKNEQNKNFEHQTDKNISVTDKQQKPNDMKLYKKKPKITNQQAYEIVNEPEKQQVYSYGNIPNKVFDQQHHDKTMSEYGNQQIPLNNKVNKLLDQRLNDNISKSKTQQKEHDNIRQKTTSENELDKNISTFDRQQRPYETVSKQYFDHEFDDTSKLSKSQKVPASSKTKEIKPKQYKNMKNNIIDKQLYNNISKDNNIMSNEILDQKIDDKFVSASGSQYLPLKYKANKSIDQNLNNATNMSEGQQTSKEQQFNKMNIGSLDKPSNVTNQQLNDNISAAISEYDDFTNLQDETQQIKYTQYKESDNISGTKNDNLPKENLITKHPQTQNNLDADFCECSCVCHNKSNHKNLELQSTNAPNKKKDNDCACVTNPSIFTIIKKTLINNLGPMIGVEIENENLCKCLNNTLDESVKNILGTVELCKCEVCRCPTSDKKIEDDSFGKDKPIPFHNDNRRDSNICECSECKCKTKKITTKIYKDEKNFDDSSETLSQSLSMETTDDSSSFQSSSLEDNKQKKYTHRSYQELYDNSHLEKRKPSLENLQKNTINNFKEKKSDPSGPSKKLGSLDEISRNKQKQSKHGKHKSRNDPTNSLEGKTDNSQNTQHKISNTDVNPVQSEFIGTVNLDKSQNDSKESSFMYYPQTKPIHNKAISNTLCNCDSSPNSTSNTMSEQNLVSGEDKNYADTVSQSNKYLESEKNTSSTKCCCDYQIKLLGVTLTGGNKDNVKKQDSIDDKKNRKTNEHKIDKADQKTGDGKSYNVKQKNSDLSCIKNLEENTFKLLEEYMKKRLEEYRLSCNPNCLKSNIQDRMFIEMFQNVKHTVSENVRQIDCLCSDTSPESGPKNRAYDLLQEYLKMKINRVKCQCEGVETYKSNIVSDIYEKVCKQIENDFSRIKNLCASCNTQNDEKNNLQFEIPEKDKMISKNDENVLMVSAQNSPLIQIDNNSSQKKNETVPLKTGKTVQTGKSITCSCISSGYCKTPKETIRNDYVIQQCNVLIQKPELHKDKYQSLENTLGTETELLTKCCSNSFSHDNSRLSSPYIGYTLDCSSTCSYTESCSCLKCTAKRNKNVRQNLWSIYTNFNTPVRRFSYIMSNVAKTEMIDHNFVNSTLCQSNITSDKCEEQCVTSLTSDLVLKMSKENMHTVTRAMDTTSFSEGLVKVDCLKNKFRKLFDVNLCNHQRSRLKDDSCHVPMSRSCCDCYKVPICHVKMLMENIEYKLCESKCTCDTLNANVCPIHSTLSQKS